MKTNPLADSDPPANILGRIRINAYIIRILVILPNSNYQKFIMT